MRGEGKLPSAKSLAVSAFQEHLLHVGCARGIAASNTQALPSPNAEFKREDRQVSRQFPPRMMGRRESRGAGVRGEGWPGWSKGERAKKASLGSSID